jgi:hypothetical protein
VNEGSTVNVVVLRANALDQAVSVDFTTINGTAIAGQDYTAARGTLTFEPNETQKTVTIQTLADDIDEDPETFRFRLFFLGGATSTATLGTPSEVIITINRSGASDRPDLQIAAKQFMKFAGRNIFNTSGDGQIASLNVKSGGQANFIVRLRNSGNLTDSFTLKATGAGTATGATVRYFRNGNEVTARITSSEGLPVKDLKPGARQDIEVRIQFKGGRQFQGYGARVTVASVNTPSLQDAVRAVTIIR